MPKPCWPLGPILSTLVGNRPAPELLPVPAEVEQERAVPVIREIVQRYGALVSVDTYRASVAAAALGCGSGVGQ